MRPKSEIYTPKRDDEHSRPFQMGVPHPPPPPPPWDKRPLEKLIASSSPIPSSLESGTRVSDDCNYLTSICFALKTIPWAPSPMFPRIVYCPQCPMTTVNSTVSRCCKAKSNSSVVAKLLLRKKIHYFLNL